MIQISSFFSVVTFLVQVICTVPVVECKFFLFYDWASLVVPCVLTCGFCLRAVSTHRCAVLGNVNYIRRDEARRYVGEGWIRSALLLTPKVPVGLLGRWCANYFFGRSWLLNFDCYTCSYRSWVSAANIFTGYRLYGLEFESLQGQKVLSASNPFGSGANPTSYWMDTGVFSREQKRPTREVDRSLASNA